MGGGEKSEGKEESNRVQEIENCQIRQASNGDKEIKLAPMEGRDGEVFGKARVRF